MFKDYYALLVIDQDATDEEIRSAFKRQALRWHPDRNPGVDTTSKMQDINEAKLILLDSEARQKYDIEYNKYQEYIKQRKQKQEQAANNKQDQETAYNIADATLYKWMKNAQMQAVELAKQTINDFKGMATAGLEAGIKASGKAFLNQLIFGAIILVIFGVVKSCK